jgi:uncharacterized protein YdcH (DUF465 family)
MADNNPYAEYSSTDLYNDGTGKGAVVAPPISDADTAAASMATIQGAGTGKKKKQPAAESIDYLESLFDGENLSEDFKLKAKTIFEAAIAEKVSIIEAHILEAAKEIIHEQVNEHGENLVEQVDGYLDYVISEWMQENKVAVERGLRTEIAENFIMGLKDLFENSFIDVPQEKYNVLDDVFEANEELQENVNNLMKQNMELKNEITAHLCAEAFVSETSGLAATQVEKLAKLSEGIEFDTVDQYRQKVALLRESYFNRNAPVASSQVSVPQTQQSLTEDAQFNGAYVSDNSNNDPLMESVVNTISLLQKNQPKIEKVHSSKNAQRLSSLINPGIVQDNYI